MLSHAHSLLDQVVQVFRDVWCQTLGLEDAEDLVARQRLDVGNTLGVPKPDTCAQPQDARSVTDIISKCHSKIAQDDQDRQDHKQTAEKTSQDKIMALVRNAPILDGVRPLRASL